MKNVLKRLIELINLFKDDTKISTNKIKDSIPDYRDLNDQAFRRAFERDGKQCVQKTTDNEIMGCHETDDEAIAQMRALYAAEENE